MPFSSSSSMKKKPHFRIQYVVNVACILLMVFCQKYVDAQSNEAQVMAELKKGLVLPKDMWQEPDYCSWSGISCKSGQVVRIQLKEILTPPITGTLPDGLKSLTSLNHLELRQTRIGGALPSLNGLSSLREILLSENNFTSMAGDFFEGLTSLESVAMDKIPLAPGPIPQSLSSCSNLKNFSMNSANINGMIPGFFNADNFPSLIELHLSSNILEGGLPSNFSKLTMLQSLWLNGNNLNGTVEALKDMTGLSQVWLNKNSFTGPLPDFTGLTQLVEFNIRDNQITGPVPDSLTKLASLQVVNLTNNLLQGPAPVFGKGVQVDMHAGTNLFCLDTPGQACADSVNTMILVAKNWGYPAKLVKDWNGNDPCGWPGVSCIGGKITSINFPSHDLTGTISPDFSKITSLQTLILSRNHLYGTIPTELTKLPDLKLLDVSSNDLNGLVPPFKSGITVKYDGNPSIGLPKDSPSSPGGSPDKGTGGDGGKGGSGSGGGGGGGVGGKRVPVGAIVGVVIAVVAILLIALIGFCVYKKKHKSGRIPNAMVVHPHHSGSDNDMVKITVAGSNYNIGAASESLSHGSSGSNDVQMVEAGNMVISIQVLRDVTNNFSNDNVLGRGGFGTVYRGELHDGTKIAVKRMESGVMGSKGLAEFKSEIAVLNKVRHRHLVSLIGYCVDGNERILVYEYMPQGTLSQHLFNWREEDLKPLQWTRRLSIALDVARGVEYLHGLASQSFIHRDLKPSNILLGDDMRAKVADFGLVRLAPEGKASIETRLAGTFGYLAPEYAATGRVTTKVDVYAFGVILMELITGRRALDESQPEESMHLVTWFRRMHINKDTFRKAIDPIIDADEEALASISTVSELAGYCCSREPHQRPDMGHVVNVLSSFVELWKPSDKDPEDIYGIDMDLSLPQAVKIWKAHDGSSSMDHDTSSFLASMDNTQSSIPTHPEGFGQSFMSGDGR